MIMTCPRRTLSCGLLALASCSLLQEAIAEGVDVLYPCQDITGSWKSEPYGYHQMSYNTSTGLFDKLTIPNINCTFDFEPFSEGDGGCTFTGLNTWASADGKYGDSEVFIGSFLETPASFSFRELHQLPNLGGLEVQAGKFYGTLRGEDEMFISHEVHTMSHSTIGYFRAVLRRERNNQTSPVPEAEANENAVTSGSGSTRRLHFQPVRNLVSSLFGFLI